MSRTSRRISRLLIVGLAVVVALGMAFTLHKLHKQRPASASNQSVPTVAPAPIALMAQSTTQIPAPPVIPAPPATQFASVEPTALVTQTPTEKVVSDPAPKAVVAVANSTPPTVQAVPTEETDSPASLEAWAHGGKPVARTPSALASNATPPVRAELSGQSVADVKARADAGDPIAARQLLNDNLLSGKSADPDSIKKQIEKLNEDIIFSARKFTDDPWGGVYQVAGGERLGTIANRNNVSWEFLSRINGITPKRLRSGQGIKVFKGPFHAIVYKHQFKMEIYLGAPGGEGSMYVRSFSVGLGKDNSTPTGLWMCKAGDKIRNPRYYPPRGGDVIASDDPKNPLAGYWIALEGVDGQALGKESYGIHGTIDPTSIGKMESMGCIRLGAEDIAWVFDLLVDGKSKVLVKD